MADKQAYIVTDIGYGDGGKGTTVDYLCRTAESAVVVRHNGGAQAAHNVVTSDGRHHTFAQFGSGSFVPGVRTHLGPHVMINPTNMINEATHLELVGISDPFSRVSVDAEAPILTPWHKAATRIRETARGDARHGSTGQGIGDLGWDLVNRPRNVLRAKHLSSPNDALAVTLKRIRDAKYEYLREELGLGEDDWDEGEDWRVFHDYKLIDSVIRDYMNWESNVRVVEGDYLKALVDQTEIVVFEGSQGVLLDEWWGFYPYTTWSDTTGQYAYDILHDLHYSEKISQLGVMRAYTTRHGPGPLATEDENLGLYLPDYHNAEGKYQGNFRYGYLDTVAHRYALEVGARFDSLVVTNLDRLDQMSRIKVCEAYLYEDDQFARWLPLGNKYDLVQREELTKRLLRAKPIYRDVSRDNYIDMIESELGLPVNLASYGPTAEDKQYRAWVPA